jgi:hypothetical protein
MTLKNIGMVSYSSDRGSLGANIPLQKESPITGEKLMLAVSETPHLGMKLYGIFQYERRASIATKE